VGGRPVHRPGSGWQFIYKDGKAEAGWQAICDAFPDEGLDAWEHLTRTPHVPTGRYHPLAGGREWIRVGNAELRCWQWEIGGAARIWVAVDAAAMVAYLALATIGHPKQTDRPRRRQR